MYKFMSWLVIAFIGLVPLGAFFDTKQPPKPNMEQFFMKRQKRATNSSQCGKSCELEFVNLLLQEIIKLVSIAIKLVIPKINNNFFILTFFSLPINLFSFLEKNLF